MRQQTVLVVSLLLLFVGQAASSEDVDCGAAGDGCASKQWQDFELAAAKQFPEWPEVGYRTYASPYAARRLAHCKSFVSPALFALPKL